MSHAKMANLYELVLAYKEVQARFSNPPAPLSLHKSTGGLCLTHLAEAKSMGEGLVSY